MYFFLIAQSLKPQRNETNKNNITHRSDVKPIYPEVKERTNHASRDGVTAIVRGTQQIWKPYSPAYIGSL